MNITTRLNACLKGGNLTVADLARWFDRPHPTVTGWVRGGDVGAAPLDLAAIEKKLTTLEQRIRRRKGLPMPPLSPRERVAYILKLKKE